MNSKTSKLRDAVVLALIASAGTAATASAQEGKSGQAGTTQLDRIEVTGSRIKRTDVEGPSPVSVISRQDIETSGEISVADFLRNNIYNSFGSTRESSGSATGSAATISLRGLGSEYTLVLLDGRRMTSSPTLGGGAQNINLIPTAAVERIEILREGAGAVYGSDAIGGVVNVILRKDYEGLGFSVGYENPEIGPAGRTGSLSGGISSDRGNLTFVIDHQERELMYNRDIKKYVTDAGLTWGLSPYNSSATFSGARTGSASIANCDTFENSVRMSPTRCGFDHGATSANEASMSRDSLLLNGNYQLTDNTSFFFRAIASDTKSVGVYASAPVDNAGGGRPLTIAADNPFNPFGEDGVLSYRFTPLGTRDAVRRDTYRDFNFGLRGTLDLFGGADWEVGVGHGRVRQSSVNYNYGIGSILQDMVDSGQYNPFDPTHPSVAAAAPKIAHTVYVESEQRTVSADGNISFDLFQMPAGAVSFVTGFEYRDDRLSMAYDAQSAAGNVFGSAGAGTGGERSYYAGYFETLIPLFSSLTATVAGRYDSYNDLGSKFSPRVSLEFRPIDSLLVRGSWGKGFRAPTLDDMYGSNSTTNLNSPVLSAIGHNGGDELACRALAAVQASTGNAGYQPYPVDPCSTSSQYQWLVSSNRNLKPEESKNWNVGFVFSPTEALSMAVDYYDVQIDNVITSVPRPLAWRYGDAGQTGYGVDRGPDITAPNGAVLPGIPFQIKLPIDNGASKKVRGIDAELNFRQSLGTYGDLMARLNWAHQIEFTETSIINDKVDLLGTGGYPKDRAQFTLGWSYGDVSIAAITNYIGKSGSEDTRLPSWITNDLQLTWNAPWKGKVTLGVRNVGNKLPPFNDALNSFPYYDNSLYNIWGRTPYMRYEQNF
ncbi:MULTISPECIES: TonB-dependent receptor plug domain-containing protein [Stenotrophomonas]|uniref:TonB-dependent receptor n=1 Tax=Stenotrophomonas maltophilia TaxID=40324 RepID=A0A3S0HVS3_STEMA|nr:TonB-dependent receptor [Stenotrophomonas maltophilia]RTQ88776.1 TonB-dependent receptor [Stenotrophomonas maltophilia]